MDADLQTTQLRVLADHIRRGVPGALDELLRRASRRMEHLARAMLRRYPAVRAREQTADLIQEASLSLLNALRGLTFSSTREFYGLVNEHLRRRLLDLARRYRNPVRSPAPLAAAADEALPSGPADDDLERWQAFHEAVAVLPADCREAFSLRFYHDYGVDEVAEVLQVSLRTASRLYARAILALTARLGDGGLPPPDEPAKE